MTSVKLGVNIDHVATLRQQRLGRFPDVLQAALLAEQSGAQGITVHLREDRRHIQDADVLLLKKKIKTKLNLEMAATPAMVDFACRLRPACVCLVPEKRRELTTEGGLNAAALQKKLFSAVQRLKKAQVSVSIFIDPQIQQIQACHALGADTVELHTGAYAQKTAAARRDELKKLQQAAAATRSYGLILNAGHGLDYDNVGPIARLQGMNELNIGFAIIARAVFVGLGSAVKEMHQLIYGTGRNS